MTAEQAGQQPQLHPQAEWQARLASRDAALRVHLIGIGGTGLSAIAQVLLELGMQVSGSDRQAGPTLDRLAAAGARVSIGQSAANLLDLPADARPHVVLLSSAVDAANPERQAAQALGLSLVKRSEFLPALLAGRRLIAIAGTHGKTTTTAMTVQALRQAGIDCGYIIGSEVPVYGNGAAGSAPEFVLEADEYDHMFLGLRPQVAVVTNAGQLPPRIYAVHRQCGSRWRDHRLRRRSGRNARPRLCADTRPALAALWHGGQRRSAGEQHPPPARLRH
jgi:UDP-N-acetylmuramate--alanine ligase